MKDIALYEITADVFNAMDPATREADALALMARLAQEHHDNPFPADGSVFGPWPNIPEGKALQLLVRHT